MNLIAESLVGLKNRTLSLLEVSFQRTFEETKSVFQLRLRLVYRNADRLPADFANLSRSAIKKSTGVWFLVSELRAESGDSISLFKVISFQRRVLSKADRSNST